MHSTTNNTDANFDDLMASLFILVTHHSLAQCNATLPVIVERLNQLSHHPEIEFFPNQQKVIAKMQQLWRARLFQEQTRNQIH